MAEMILIDEWHVTLGAARDLPAAEYDAIRRALDDRPFRVRLRRAVRAAIRAVARRQPALSNIRVAISR